jgi:hypothetical protein
MGSVGILNGNGRLGLDALAHILPELRKFFQHPGWPCPGTPSIPQVVIGGVVIGGVDIDGVDIDGVDIDGSLFHG